MHKLLLTIFCFFFPIFILPDFTPILQLMLIGLLYEAKVTVGLLLICTLAGLWSIVVFYRFLLGELKGRNFIELAVTIGICWGTYSVAKFKLKKLHRRPLKLLRGELPSIPHF